MTRVRLVPVVSDREPEDVEVPDDATVGQAILSRFPDLEGDRLVVQDRQGRPIRPTTLARDVDSVSFMPFSEGGWFGGDYKRIETEVLQLRLAHPEVVRTGNCLHSRFDPR